MDKETFSSYGWLVVTVLVIAAMITFAPTFADTITSAVEGLLGQFGDQANGAISAIPSV